MAVSDRSGLFRAGSVLFWGVPGGSGGFQGMKIWLHGISGCRKHTCNLFQSFSIMLQVCSGRFLPIPAFSMYPFSISSHSGGSENRFTVFQESKHPFLGYSVCSYLSFKAIPGWLFKAGYFGPFRAVSRASWVFRAVWGWFRLFWIVYISYTDGLGLFRGVPGIPFHSGF